jgi:hypothetical protein
MPAAEETTSGEARNEATPGPYLGFGIGGGAACRDVSTPTTKSSPSAGVV